MIVSVCISGERQKRANFTADFNISFALRKFVSELIATMSIIVFIGIEGFARIITFVYKEIP